MVKKKSKVREYFLNLNSKKCKFCGWVNIINATRMKDHLIKCSCVPSYVSKFFSSKNKCSFNAEVTGIESSSDSSIEPLEQEQTKRSLSAEPGTSTSSTQVAEDKSKTPIQIPLSKTKENQKGLASFFDTIKSSEQDYEVDLYLRQKWQDERLKHENITESLDLNDPNLVKAIWKPEVYFPNAKHAEFQFVTVPNVLVRIHPDGEILYMLRLKLTFSCMMDLSKFPLDSQVCTMEVASFSKTTEELKLEWKSVNPIIMGRGLKMPQFEIVEIIASDCQESFQIGNYSCLVAEFYLSRSVGFHLVQSYLPTILIVVISWVSFWMDVDSVPGRTTLGVTTLLAVSSQSSGIQSGLPQVSYVKAIDVWMGTCTAFVFCALLEFTFVNYMWRKLQPEMLRKLITIPETVNGEADLKKLDMSSSTEPNAGITVVKKVIVQEDGPEQYCLPAGKNVMARRIDEYSRLIFPLAFALFNTVYWSYYLVK